MLNRQLFLLRVKVLLLVVINFMCPHVLFAYEEIDRHLYVFHVGDTIKIGWDAGSGADWHEGRLYHFEFDQEMRLQAIAKVPMPLTVVTFVAPTSGHYEVWVRAWKTVDPEDKYSEWAKSINSEEALVGGDPRAWWIYTYVAAPAGGGIF